MRGKVAKQLRRRVRGYKIRSGSGVPFRQAYRALKKRYKRKKKNG